METCYWTCENEVRLIFLSKKRFGMESDFWMKICNEKVSTTFNCFSNIDDKSLGHSQKLAFLDCWHTKSRAKNALSAWRDVTRWVYCLEIESVFVYCSHRRRRCNVNSTIRSLPSQVYYAYNGILLTQDAYDVIVMPRPNPNVWDGRFGILGPVQNRILSGRDE